MPPNRDPRFGGKTPETKLPGSFGLSPLVYPGYPGALLIM
ncbi:hypothetical protein OP10G_4338 [Fimbriimonas ginsengisoli Gsoil 348]|uniref:Uncharacterized protein n=1 Tax=Fimbriimonas ginsengisoli Gsoil 348 TaxID=661478 RepID=A0A068NW81_FIMGI|nr:hypothetical protein OP10G_4338 [Fimbriimonas ginsengisoli Gsoil 348]